MGTNTYLKGWKFVDCKYSLVNDHDHKRCDSIKHGARYAEEPNLIHLRHRPGITSVVIAVHCYIA